MRIVYLWDSEYPWDVRVEKICTTLAGHGHELLVVSRNRRWEGIEERLGALRVRRLRPWTWFGQRLDAALSFPFFLNPRWSATLGTAMREFRADLLIVRDLPLAPLAVRLGRRAGVPVVLDMAENYPAMIQLIWQSGRARPWDVVVRNPRVVAAVERWVLPRVQALWVDVEEQRDRLERIHRRLPPTTVIRNTPPRARAQVHPPTEAPRSGKTDTADTLEAVYLGILEIPRGIDEMIAAVGRLRARGRRVRLVLVGSGRDQEHFRRAAAAAGLGDDAVEFCGYVPNAQALERLQRADVGLNPIHANEKHDTTLPNKLFDYMAAGIPVLTSDSAPSARVVRSTGCGLVFRSGDASDAATALESMFDVVRRADMGRRGRKAVLEEYNWERDTVRLLESVGSLDTARARRTAT